MPLPDGTLTSAEFATAVNRLHELWQLKTSPPEPKACPSCGNGTFFFHPSLLGNPSDTIATDRRHTRLPAVAVYCQRCGYAEQYVAACLGLDALNVEDPSRDLRK